jgi:23S rRNA (adenine2503-C2)-methyltransferase
MMKRSFFSLSYDELTSWLSNHGEKPFRARQLFEWIYTKKADTWEAMTNLSTKLRDLLKENFTLSAMELKECEQSDDKETYKFLWQLHDGAYVESVLILSGSRRSVCVSSQVGCPVACAFCASGKLGFKRNLTFDEILQQVWNIDIWLHKNYGETVSHVIFMGMGEPLKNEEEVFTALKGLNNKNMFNISQRRITISTVGIPEGIKHLADNGIKVHIALSLHAPNDAIRKQIIPYAKKYSIKELFAALDYYFAVTKRNITFEYTLIDGINDGVSHARDLIKLIGDRQCSVNLIPYNPVEGVEFTRPSGKNIMRFKDILTNAGIPTTCRYRKGDDIGAACGQLALKNKEEKR